MLLKSCQGKSALNRIEAICKKHSMILLVSKVLHTSKTKISMPKYGDFGPSG